MKSDSKYSAVKFGVNSLLAGTVAICLIFLQGCSNAGEGAVSGAAVGALSGLAIGSITGEAGAGAAIGAVVGGVGGAVIGDQKKRRDEAAKAAAQTPSQPTYATGVALGKFVGTWKVSGTVQNNGATLPVNGTAKGVVDKTYFVRLDIQLKDPRNGQTVEGTSIISQTGGRNLDMTNSYNTAPQVNRFRGEMDASGNVFNFTQVDSFNQPRSIVLRMGENRTFTAEAWDGNRRAETRNFTYVGP